MQSGFVAKPACVQVTYIKQSGKPHIIMRKFGRGVNRPEYGIWNWRHCN